MPTAIARALLLKKKLEGEVGRKVEKRPSEFPTVLNRNVPRLKHPDEGKCGDLILDSQFITSREFTLNIDHSFVGEDLWLRGRLWSTEGQLVLQFDLQTLVCTATDVEVVEYAKTLPCGSMVDIFGKLVDMNGSLELQFTNLYGISLGTGFEKLGDFLEMGIFTVQSYFEQYFREHLLANDYLEVHTSKTALMTLRKDVERVFAFYPCHRDSFEVVLEVLSEIKENYSEVVQFIKELLQFVLDQQYRTDRFTNIIQQAAPFQDLELTETILVLTATEVVNLFARDSVSEYNDLAKTEIAALVKRLYNTDIFIVDKLPLATSVMPDPFNHQVCNKFEVLLCGQTIATGQQNVHDGSLLGDNTWDPHQGTMPNTKFVADIGALSKLYVSQGEYEYSS